MPFIDEFGRQLDYLRVSVTDRCNQRCIYCMPVQKLEKKNRTKILTLEEMERVVEFFARQGLHTLRFTGGEPLLRKDLTLLVERVASWGLIPDLALTTNGVFLAEKALDLKGAGLDRVNVSLDTVDPKTYRRITGRGSLADVLEGVEEALSAGLTPVKINAVILRGINDDMESLKGFLDFMKRYPIHLRFIELMPIGKQEGFFEERYLPAPALIRRLNRLLPLRPVEAEGEGPQGSGPARYYSIGNDDIRGKLGIISPVSDHFCTTCSRLRLTAEGKLHVCLLRRKGLDLKPALRGEEDLETLIRRAVALKPEKHDLDEQLELVEKRMFKLGG